MPPLWPSRANSPQRKSEFQNTLLVRREPHRPQTLRTYAKTSRRLKADATRRGFRISTKPPISLMAEQIVIALGDSQHFVD
jgi:hypothetical protein